VFAKNDIEPQQRVFGPTDLEPVHTTVQRPSFGGFSAILCCKASPNLRVRLRFAPRLTKNSLKI
jgi:hypothetical protein